MLTEFTISSHFHLGLGLGRLHAKKNVEKNGKKLFDFYIIEGIRALSLKTRYIHTYMFKYGKAAKAVIYKDPHSTCTHKSIKARSLLAITLTLIIFYYWSG